MTITIYCWRTRQEMIRGEHGCRARQESIQPSGHTDYNSKLIPSGGTDYLLPVNVDAWRAEVEVS